MERSTALDGGRILKAGLLAFGTLLFAAPLAAQPTRDPLAPLPTTSPTAQPTSPVGTQPAPLGTAQPFAPAAAPAVPAAAVPRDWRGVFDAIDAGNWAAAQAGISTLPPSPLTPVARAELYTAKNSPVVDGASLQALIAQAPELPEANQLGLMALKRNPAATLMVLPEKQTVVLGSAPVRYRAHPVPADPAADGLLRVLQGR